MDERNRGWKTEWKQTVETDRQERVYSRHSIDSTGFSVRSGLLVPGGTSGCGPLAYVSCVHTAAGMGLSPLNELITLVLIGGSPKCM